MDRMNHTGAIDPRAPAGIPQPAMGRIKTARVLFGVSRSWLYRQAKVTPLLFRKSGRSTLVDFTVLREILYGLPLADIR